MTEKAGSSQASSMERRALHLASDDRIRDEAQFRRLFDMHFDYVWRSLRRLGVPARDLEDLTHDVFLRVYGQLHRYDSTRPLRPWLFAFVFRMASDYRRLSRNQRELLDADVDVADPDASPVDRLVRAEALSVGQAALECLDIERRAVFILHELDGSPIPEVAAALAIPVNTAYSRLRSARDQFDSAVRRLRLRRGDR